MTTAARVCASWRPVARVGEKGDRASMSIAKRGNGIDARIGSAMAARSRNRTAQLPQRNRHHGRTAEAPGATSVTLSLGTRRRARRRRRCRRRRRLVPLACMRL